MKKKSSGRIMIRDAKIDDFDELTPLFIEAHRNTSFKDSPIDMTHMKRVFSTLVAMPNLFCQVVENDGKLIGVLGGGIDKNAWGVEMAMDVIFLSKRDTHKLLLNFIKWAKENGAMYVHITSLVNNERYDTLLKKIGLKEAGHCFAMET